MVWLIVAIVLLAAFGPVLYLRPSARDKQLTRLRESARRHGLAVDIKAVPKLDAAPQERVSASGVERHPTELCASYRLPMGTLPDAPVWAVLRDPSSRVPASGWSYWAGRDKSETVPGEVFDALDRSVAAFQWGCVAAEGDTSGVSWYWRERIGETPPDTAVSALREALEALAALQRASDRAAGEDGPNAPD